MRRSGGRCWVVVSLACGFLRANVWCVLPPSTLPTTRAFFRFHFLLLPLLPRIVLPPPQNQFCSSTSTSAVVALLTRSCKLATSCPRSRPSPFCFIISSILLISVLPCLWILVSKLLTWVATCPRNITQNPHIMIPKQGVSISHVQVHLAYVRA